MTQVLTAIDRTARRVLENWAMMFVDAKEDWSGIGEEDLTYASTISFRGNYNGEISVIAPKSFLKLLAANVLGELSGDEISEEQLHDAFRELANLLAGNFLTEKFGVDEVFDVVMPQVRILDKSLLEKFRKEETALYLADQEPVAVTVSLDN